MKQLKQAQKEVDLLVAFLQKRDYISVDGLALPLENAEKEIERIVNQVIDGVLSELEHYAGEAQLYANGEIPDAQLTKAERAKEATIAKRIRKAQDTLLKLRIEK